MNLSACWAARGKGFAIPLLALVSAMAVACASLPVDSGDPSESQTPVEADAGSLTTILATKDLRVGTQRVSFLLATPSALVKSPNAFVATRRLDGTGEVVETKIADFHLWPYGIRGAYSTELTFDRPGTWQLEVSVQDGDFDGSGRLEVDIAEKSLVPDVGSVPPLSRTKTLRTVGDVQLLTTDFTPDQDLYQVSIADAAKRNQPAVIVFATPAFCTSPTCGPQVDIVSELKDAHQGEASFIHVEIYDNPEEIQGDLSRARFAEAVEEWKLDRLPGWFNESWTFVLNSEGRVHQRFEGFVTLEELEESLQQVLAEG
jgi:hypothetical protein